MNLWHLPEEKMLGSTISLRSRDVPPPPMKDVEIAVPSPAWVPVEENEETAAPEHFSGDADEKEEEEGSELTSSIRSLNNKSSDDNLFDGDEETVCCTSETCRDRNVEEPTTNCCKLKGIGNTLARGFCRIMNTLVSCVKEKLTSRQMFILVGAVIAAIFKTKNVATGGKEDPLVEDENGDNVTSNASSTDIVSTIVDATVNNSTNEH